jgi:site-specific recombinase XerD
MGQIRDRMLEELELRGMSKATKKSYVLCCRVFVAHFMRSPELLRADDITAFLLHLKRDRKAGPSCVGVYVAAIRFLYRSVLRNPEVVADLPRPRIPKTLSQVLSREEVEQLLGAVRSIKHRTILMAAYGAGLRISEALRLRVEDIDSKRMVIHVRGAKQGKDRFVLLSPRLLEALRRYWVESKPRGPYLFPSRSGRPVSIDVIRRVFKATVNEIGFKKRVTLHSLRHGFATHLLEDGTDIRVIQALLGHSTIETTAHYTRVSTRHMQTVTSPLDRLAPSRDTTPR